MINARKGKGNAWVLDRKLDQPTDEEAGRNSDNGWRQGKLSFVLIRYHVPNVSVIKISESEFCSNLMKRYGDMTCLILQKFSSLLAS